MSRTDQEKWDARYAEQDPRDVSAPSELLKTAFTRFDGTDRTPTALDLACGGGRNSLWLAEQGFEVDAVDVSSEGLALAAKREAQSAQEKTDQAAVDSRAIRWRHADLDDGFPLTGTWDLILIIRYLDLALVEQASQHLNPGGLLVVELHMDPGNETVAGPRNPNFLVAPGALAAATTGLTTLLLEEGIVQTGPNRREALARYIGRLSA